MDVLVTGADGELGRTVADGFRRAGHRVVLAGWAAHERESAAGDRPDGAIVCDPTDPASLAAAQPGFPHHLDAVITVPSQGWSGDDPHAFALVDTAHAWRSAFDRTVLAAVLSVQAVGDNLRSGGSIVTVAPAHDDGPEAAAKAALSHWTAAQADHFGTRGITVNTLAFGLPAAAGYLGSTGAEPSAGAAIARLALFLATPAARHITGQTLHVGRGAAVSYG